jgi:hypothetical protein
MTTPIFPAATRPPAHAYFERARETFEAATRAAPALERRLRIAGRAVRLRFAGPALLHELGPGLEHLACDAPPTADPDLTVLVWDSASTGTRMPPPPWTPEDHLAHGLIRGFTDERFATVFQPHAGTLSMLDARARTALFWTRDAGDIPWYERASPFRAIIQFWAFGRGVHLVHGAAVGTARGGALIVGAGGSGKSTAALAALAHGLLYAGDDVTLVDLGPPPVVHGLYRSAKLHPPDLARFPDLRPLVRNADALEREKALLLLDGPARARIVPELALRAVLVPRVSCRPETRIRPCTPGRAHLALAPSTLLQVPGARPESLVALGRLARELPCFVLESGSDLPGLARAIERLLEGL